jgi:hypothetical protein
MVIHEIPLAQLFALNAVGAWNNGLEPSGENYDDRDMNAELERMMKDSN